MVPESDIVADLAAVMDLVAAGRDDLALPRIEQLCRLRPDAADLQWIRARCLLFLGRDEGLQASDGAVALDPDGVAHGRRLVADLVVSGRFTAAVLLFQRLGGGPVERAQRWACRARRLLPAAFFVVLVPFLLVGPLFAVILASSAWILVFELVLFLAGRRFRDLPELDQLILLHVIESQARTHPRFTITRRDAVALIALGLSAMALGAGLWSVATEAEPVSSGLIGVLGGAGAVVLTAGGLALRRDLIGRRGNARFLEESRSVEPGFEAFASPGDESEPDPVKADEPALASLEADVRSALLPELIAQRRHADIVRATADIDVATLPEPVRSQVAHALRVVAEQMLAERALVGDDDVQQPLDLLGRAHLACPHDRQLLRLAARSGRARLHRRRSARVPLPEGVRLAMRRFPRWRDPRIVAPAAVAAGTISASCAVIVTGSAGAGAGLLLAPTPFLPRLAWWWARRRFD